MEQSACSFFSIADGLLTHRYATLVLLDALKIMAGLGHGTLCLLVSIPRITDTSAE
jgi:hypothetical protein